MKRDVKVEEAHLKDLVPDSQNARRHNPRNIGFIVDSLHQVGAARSGVVDENNRILAGNGTWEALAEAGIERVKIVEADGNEWVVVRRRGLSDEQKIRLSLADNRSAELADWDPEMLAAIAKEQPEALAGLWTDDELRALMAATPGEDVATTPEQRPTLADRFIVPPFSVLDARQGYWQERKRQWLALGIQSELGRGDNMVDGGHSDQSINIDFYSLKRRLEAELGRELSTDEAREILLQRGEIRHITRTKADKLATPGGGGDPTSTARLSRSTGGYKAAPKSVNGRERERERE